MGLGSAGTRWKVHELRGQDRNPTPWAVSVGSTEWLAAHRKGNHHFPEGSRGYGGSS